MLTISYVGMKIASFMTKIPFTLTQILHAFFFFYFLFDCNMILLGAGPFMLRIAI